MRSCSKLTMIEDPIVSQKIPNVGRDPVIIALASKHDPGEIVGWFDGSASRFSTDRTRAINFDDPGAAYSILERLRFQLPRIANFITVRSE